MAIDDVGAICTFFIDRLEYLNYDLQLRTRFLSEQTTPTSVAIIDIDDKSIEKIGHWPWPRNKLTELINEVKNQGAAVIAFDIFFSEEEKNVATNVLQHLKEKKIVSSSEYLSLKKDEFFSPGETSLAKSLQGYPFVLAFGFLPKNQTQNVLPEPLLILNEQDKRDLDLIEAAGYISNVPILQTAVKHAGFLNIFPDSDGIIRRAPLLMAYHSGIYPSLALQAVLIFLNEDISLFTPLYSNKKRLEGIKIGAMTIPTDMEGQVLIPFIGKSYTFPYYSAVDVMHKKIDRRALQGKIVFIGTSATGLGDLKPTAIQNPFPGVEIQASIANGILHNHFYHRPAWVEGADIVVTLLLGIISACIFPYFGPRVLGLLMLLLPLAMLLISHWILKSTGLVLFFLIPISLVIVIAIFNIIYGYLFETRRRERLRKMFGQYVPEEHIDEMLRSKGDYGWYGETREMTVLFSDIRNFTTVSEDMPAAELVEMLNTFFTPMTEIIFKHHGTIDKYVGDLIMAFWSAPLIDKNHARHAIESALEMQEKVEKLNTLFTQKNWPKIKIGIGINTGLMNVGDMGSNFRRNYTVLGDAVNLASRVEGLTKFYGVEIIVTEHTARQQKGFVFRQLDRVKVKGKKTSMSIAEVICKRSALTEEISEELALYHQALHDYFAQRWEQSLNLMSELHQKYPNKKLYTVYIERIQEFRNHTLPADWDGVFRHMEK